MADKGGMEAAAISVLKRAVEMDENKRYTMALVLYEEGIRILLDCLKEIKTSGKQRHFSTMASQYLERAEKVKALINKGKMAGTYREVIKVEDGATGHGYGSVFGRFLDGTVTHIRIEDPYIRAFHQCQNLVRLCELAVTKCNALSRISLITTLDPVDKEQVKRLDSVKQSLREHSISFDYEFSETLHDRQILLSNGWIIKIGRGLSYFKAPSNKFALGTYELELRACLETTIDIYHTTHLENNTI